MKYAWIDTHRQTYGLAESRTVLGVSLSGYHAWKRGGTPDRKRLTDAQMLALTQAIHRELKAAPLGDNRRRRHSTLGYASLQQFLNNWLSSQHEKESAA